MRTIRYFVASTDRYPHMNTIVRALLIASAATMTAAVVTATVSRRRRVAAPPHPPGDSFFVDADALSDVERQALRDELERMM